MTATINTCTVSHNVTLTIDGVVFEENVSAFQPKTDAAILHGIIGRALTRKRELSFAETGAEPGEETQAAWEAEYANDLANLELGVSVK